MPVESITGNRWRWVAGSQQKRRSALRGHIEEGRAEARPYI